MAREVGVPPTQLSFTMALHYLRYEWSWMASSSVGTLPARHACGACTNVWVSCCTPKNDGSVNAPVW